MKKIIIALFALAFASSAFADWHVTAGPKFSRIKLYNSASTTGGFVEAGYSFGWLSLDLGYDKLGSVTKDFYGASTALPADFGDVSPEIALKSESVSVIAYLTTPTWNQFSGSLGIGIEDRKSSARYFSSTDTAIYAVRSYAPVVTARISYALSPHISLALAASAEFPQMSNKWDALAYHNYKKTARLYSIEPSVSYKF